MNDTVWIKVHEHESNITLRQNKVILKEQCFYYCSTFQSQ
jgi:hypothetical protein